MSQNGLKVMNLNTGGFMGKCHNLSIIPDENEIDIVSIVEHWHKHDELALVHIENFYLVSSFCRESQNRGEVCIYASNGLSMFPMMYKKCRENVFEICSTI